MKTTKTLLAKVDPALAKRLRKRLIDDGLSFREWLEARIRWYVAPARKKEIAQIIHDNHRV